MLGRIGGLLLFGIISAQGATVFLQPDAGYLAATIGVNFNDVDESLLTSITDGVQTINFSSPMRASTVGANWASWGAPPNTESATPRVLWSGLDDNFDPVTTVLLSLSVPAAIFGFELEPGPTEVHAVAARFFMAGALQQEITLNVDGNGGALLFAAGADPGARFDSVVITSDADWAAGQFRYAEATTTIPEPDSGALLLIGLVLFLRSSRRTS